LNDRESTLKRLTLTQYETLETTVRKNQRGRLKLYVKEAGLEGKDLFNALRDADPDNVTQNHVYHYLGTRRGAIDAIELAANAAEFPDAGDFARSYDIVDATNLARALVGFEKRKSLDDDARGKTDGEDSPDPNSQASAAS
jgi:hypothetical protein